MNVQYTLLEFARRAIAQPPHNLQNRGMGTSMDFDQAYHFIFETYEGIGISILVCIVICVLLAAVLERRTRKRFVDRPKSEDDFDLFEEIDDEE